MRLARLSAGPALGSQPPDGVGWAWGKVAGKLPKRKGPRIIE